MSRGILVLATLATLAWSWKANAAGPDEAEILIQKGIELRRAHKDFEALNLFKQALTLAQTPRAYAQLGLAEQALGHWVEAEQHVGVALASPGDPWIRKNRAVLEGSHATIRSHIGQVELTGEPAGAKVKVNGLLAGTLPLGSPLHVNEGYAEVDVSATGYLPAHRTLTVNAGRSQQLFVRLEPQQIADTGGPPSTASPPLQGARSANATRQAIDEQPIPADAGKTLRTAGIGVATAGLLGIGTGVFMSLRVRSLQNKVEAGDNNPQLRDDGRQAERLQWVAYGVGAAALIGGGVLYYYGSMGATERPTRPKRLSMFAAPSSRGAMALVRYRF